MDTNRRDFLKIVGLLGAGKAASALADVPGIPQEKAGPSEEAMGVLVDLPSCIGCRKCEYACKKHAGFPVDSIESYNDKSVFSHHRRPSPDCYTKINAFPKSQDGTQPIYVKDNCFHCVDPACVSACIVGALRKHPQGAVTYDASKCIGCRYCMVACPFEIPTYEYDNALTPEVRKCTFCFDRTSKPGGVPACVEICPREVMTYGKRSELLRLAREKIGANPTKYVNHIYGEHEAGGTSWLYISDVPFEKLDYVKISNTSPARLTESVQHGIFKHFVPPLALYGLLGLIMWMNRTAPQDGGGEPVLANDSPGDPSDTADSALDRDNHKAGGKP